MSDVRWLEVSQRIGSAVWRSLRPLLGEGVSAGGTITDPDGEYGPPLVMTAFCESETGVWLLKIETRWERGADRSTAKNTYYVPNGVTDDD